MCNISNYGNLSNLSDCGIHKYTDVTYVTKYAIERSIRETLCACTLSDTSSDLIHARRQVLWSVAAAFIV